MAGAKKPVLYGGLIMHKRNYLQPFKNANTFSNLLYLQYFTMTLQRDRVIRGEAGFDPGTSA